MGKLLPLFFTACPTPVSDSSRNIPRYATAHFRLFGVGNHRVSQRKQYSPAVIESAKGPVPLLEISHVALKAWLTTRSETLFDMIFSSDERHSTGSAPRLGGSFEWRTRPDAYANPQKWDVRAEYHR